MKKRILVSLLALAACGDRPGSFDAPIATAAAPPQTLGLAQQVAVVDANDDRVVLLTPRADQELDRQALPVGRGVIRADASADGNRLFVLSTGDLVRKKDHDEKPSLTVVEAGAERRYPLEAPHSGFAIDPEGRWVAIFADPKANAQATFVENPNEIVLVDLTAPVETAVTPRTIRSFGGRPQRVSFTQTLSLPGGPRRLLVVETDEDVTLLDLDNVNATPQRPEITVRLTNGDTAVTNAPGGVVFDDGDPTRTDDARVGVRLDGSSSVVMVTLVPELPDAKPEDPTQVPNDFRAEVNLADVGGAPGDIVFVHTDAGLRLAAVVPGTSQAVLVDPETSITTNVALPEPYSKISLITNVVASAAGTDTALLYGDGGARGVAFWSLGAAEGTPYRSVEVVSLSTPVSSVTDVPPPKPQLKVLESTSADAFYVLDLQSRTAAPLTTLATPTIHVARDGQRVWAFQKGESNLAVVSLSDLHPIPLPLDRPIAAVYDVARADGGRSLVAVDTRGALGVTLLDALAPDTARARSYYGLLLEGLQ